MGVSGSFHGQKHSWEGAAQSKLKLWSGWSSFGSCWSEVGYLKASCAERGH